MDRTPPRPRPLVLQAAVESFARRHGLTPRQAQVFLLVCQGHSNASMADQLGVAENTVEVHMSGILRKLRCSNRAELLVAMLLETLPES